MSTPLISVRFEKPAHEPFRTVQSRQVFADALRARPGEWALLGRYCTQGVASQEAYVVRRVVDPKDRPSAPAGSFEAESRTMFGEHRVYVRYVGGGRA